MFIKALIPGTNRIEYSFLIKKGLPLGKWRMLTKKEVKILNKDN